MESAQPPWACFTASLSSWGKKLPLYPFLFEVMAPVSHPSTMHHCEEPGSVSLVLPLGTERLLFGLPKAVSLQVEQAWLPQPFTTGQVLQLPVILRALC